MECSAFQSEIKLFGHDHIDVAVSKYNIALLFEKEGKRDEARKLFLECEKIYSKVYGPDHTETLDAARRAEEEEDKDESEEEDEE